ncbi:hypothetical protein FHT86_007046 [Rhizobium sp. BK313]|uniref:hypothetical protein n=1 Tax=Rhizobium sp. BK313 TaxID=2587081 RepID=UPI001061FF25|nr:hypothetical protein [Rhizobium sp. BK313]MBB3458720.1 hypothetical protein [Rhizobium sp. BK313]
MQLQHHGLKPVIVVPYSARTFGHSLTQLRRRNRTLWNDQAIPLLLRLSETARHIPCNIGALLHMASGIDFTEDYGGTDDNAKLGDGQTTILHGPVSSSGASDGKDYNPAAGASV